MEDTEPLSAYDVIVIGAGHNGLTSAAFLAKAGLKVLVVEKNSYTGGATVSRVHRLSTIPNIAASLLAAGFGYRGVFIMRAASCGAMAIYLAMYLRLRQSIPALADAP